MRTPIRDQHPPRVLGEWSNRGQYGFKVKVIVKKQKSLTDRRIRGPGKTAKAPAKKKPEELAKVLQVVPAAATTTAAITLQDMANFREMLKSSLTMDISK